MKRPPPPTRQPGGGSSHSSGGAGVLPALLPPSNSAEAPHPRGASPTAQLPTDCSVESVTPSPSPSLLCSHLVNPCRGGQPISVPSPPHDGTPVSTGAKCACKVPCVVPEAGTDTQGRGSPQTQIMTLIQMMGIPPHHVFDVWEASPKKKRANWFRNTHQSVSASKIVGQHANKKGQGAVQVKRCLNLRIEMVPRRTVPSKMSFGQLEGLTWRFAPIDLLTFRLDDWRHYPHLWPPMLFIAGGASHGGSECMGR